MERLLVVDDDLSMREFLELMLTREDYDVQVASGGQEALDMAKQTRFDLVITDIRMEKVDGIAVLKGIKALNPETAVILISAFATAETAVVAMKEGAFDFIPKPFRIEELRSVIRSALVHRTPEAERLILEEKVKEGCHFGSLVGLSPAMLKVYDLVKRAAQTPTNILISGESGTGKELVARAIHDNSPRAGEKFVPINCGGMPEQLIESELFGYRKGAFTGAVADKPGLFETAHKGTIFLDEIAELSLPMQVKLLRVAQDKTYRAVGGTSERVVDVRFIAATNKDLETEVMAGRFREDLYYRLNVINIHMPPLRERKGDIPLLSQYFLEQYSRSLDKDVRKISAYALDILSNYDFPGNVRELENIIERSVALEQSNIVLPESLTLASFKQENRMGRVPASRAEGVPAGGELSTAAPENLKTGLEQTLNRLEKRLLLCALGAAKQNRQQAADLLRASPRSLRYRLAKHGLNDLTPEGLETLLRQSEAEAGPLGPLNPAWPSQGLDLDRAMLEAEKYLISRAMAKAGQTKAKAAELLGISFRSLRYRISKFGDPENM